MKGEKRIPLGNVSAMNNSLVAVLSDDRIQFRSSDEPGAGILRFENIMPWCAREGVDFPALIKIEFALSTGRIYGEYFDARFQAPSSSHASRESEDHIYIYLEKPGESAVLMIGVAGTPVVGEIRNVFIASRSRMERAAYKRIRAGMFSHWYYTFDLGDGVGRSATVSDERSATAAALENRKIILSMIEKYFGSADGLRILDVACSAGLHSFELARRGAVVTGIDWDVAAIAQAKFIQECIGEKFRHSVDFRCTDLFTFDAAPGSFDVVYCSGLFYHLQDPIGAARRLLSWCTRGVVIESSVSPREGDLFELSDPAKFPFCASWEFALVPTASMLRKVFENVGFKVEGMADASEFPIDSDTWIRYRPQNSTMGSGPVYLALSAPDQSRQRVQGEELQDKARRRVEASKRRELEVAQLAAGKREIETASLAVQRSLGRWMLGLWHGIRGRAGSSGSLRRRLYDSVLRALRHQ